MPRAFGEDYHVGNFMLKNTNVHMDPFRTVKETYHQNSIETLTGAQYKTIDMSTGVPNGGELEKYNDRILRRLDLCSAVVSFCTLIASVVIIARNFPINISLTRNVAFISRNPVHMDYMKLWHYAADDSCRYTSNKHEFEVQLMNAPWRSEGKQLFDGFVIEAPVKVSEIELCFIAFFIYLFSTSFQAFRWYNFETYINASRGPEFSRWLEYAFTSPLQILLVALSFRITNIDIILGYFGMQLALVIMGYHIEKQIKKKYKRSIENIQKPQRFYSFLHMFGIADIRGPVYLLVSWTLHLLIWGVPGLWHSDFIRWGISGDYAFVHKYQKTCFQDDDFQMPAAVDVIFWSQFILFTIFGVVCSIQFVLAYIKPVSRVEDIQNRWHHVSVCYGILSVSAKTILEIGFLLLLANGAQWLDFKAVAKDTVSRHPDIVYWEAKGNRTSRGMSLANTTCFSM